jgi:hypothetical protein
MRIRLICGFLVITAPISSINSNDADRIVARLSSNWIF